MQSVAAEMNLSETAFVLSADDGFSLRWFTPTLEVDLCGHATLASAHALWEEKVLPPGQAARFQTRSGLLTASPDGEWIELDFPSTPAEKTAAPDGLLESLGVTTAKYAGKSIFDFLIEVESESVVRSIKPDFARLSRTGARGAIVTSRSASGEFDFVSRYFAPAFGIDEDPATGSTHCALAPFWAERLHKTDFLAFQASSRGGVLRVRLRGDRVLLGGQAVTVVRGELAV